MAAGAPFAQQFAAAVPHWITMQRLLRPPASEQLCHRDLWADNLRRSGEQLCIIDWDNCGPAEPAQELAMVLFEFCYADGERAGALYAAYQDADGPARLTGAGDFTMTAAQLGHFAVTAGRQWLDASPDPTDDERKRAQAWFHESLDRPLDLEQVEMLLTAVT
jgi:Ser/Thr protein kinase RdoA (MazF antagonist)